MRFRFVRPTAHFEFLARNPNEMGLDRKPFRATALFLSRLSGFWFQTLPTNLSAAAAITFFQARHRRGTFLFLAAALWLSPLFGVAQVVPKTGQITGVVKDPSRAAVVGANVVLKDLQGTVKATTVSDGEGGYTFPSVEPDFYIVEVDAKGFKHAVSPNLEVAAGQIVRFDCDFALAEVLENVIVLAADVENAYRVEALSTGGPLGTTPIVNLPYSVNVISRQLIDDTQSRNFKEAAKYLPLVSFQEMQGPEVVRPATRGMQGSNMQNDRKDGMGFAVTTPSAMEEYEQIEVVSGVGAPLYGPANPSGTFNFITKRPTEVPLHEVELGYESNSVGTVHMDLGDRVGKNKIFGYRMNLVVADGGGYVKASQLRRQLAAGAADVRPWAHTAFEGNYSYYNLYQFGYPGWFAYAPTTTPPSVTGSKSILLPKQAPDPTIRGYGQSFSGVDLTSYIGELRAKHEFNSTWHLVVGGLDQLSNRGITTAVNQLIDNNGNYKTYDANAFSSLAQRFRVYSDLLYITGRFKTGPLLHDVVIGSTGYRFATYSPVTSPPKTALCTSNTPQGVCQANIAHPLVFVPPPGGVSPPTSNYGSSIIHQQGFSLGDTITLSRQWLVRVAASQDWTWTDSYANNAATHFVRTWTGGYVSQGVSPSASILYKPRNNMTIYGTFAQSIQPPDVAAASSGSTIVVNANQALPPYRSKEGEIGYKLKARRLDFSTAMFRVDRPFANYVVGVVSPVCGKQSGTSNCTQLEITGIQRNYGWEAMLSGRLLQSLMLTGGLTLLDPRLTDTGVPATNDKHFVGIPDYKSNILAEYRLRALAGVYLNFDWQHVGRRPIDEINSSYTPQYNVFDLGMRYTTELVGKGTTFRFTANNISSVHYWSTLGPGSITGQSTGSYLGHLGEPFVVNASVRIDF